MDNLTILDRRDLSYVQSVLNPFVIYLYKRFERFFASCLSDVYFLNETFLHRDLASVQASDQLE